MNDNLDLFVMKLDDIFDTFELGHGDSNSKNLPTLVKDLSNVGQVSCGSSHTIAVSQDGRTIWSFGGGDNGAFYCMFCMIKLIFLMSNLYFL